MSYQIVRKPTTVPKPWQEIVRFGAGGTVEALGSKGVGLSQMTAAGFPVPPGFTIQTSACIHYQTQPKSTIKALMPKVRAVLRDIRKEVGGYVSLISVRSGARVSMPGMMDTILNVGLTSGTMSFWTKRLGARAAWDCRRRLIQMYATVVNGANPVYFEEVLEEERKHMEVATDAELNETALRRVVHDFLKVGEIPDTVDGQLAGAIEAVFKSWDNPRAKKYRALHGYSDEWGTAVNIQAMVFGNAGGKSGSGVLFTRNPTTGENKVHGEFLPNAQGEDVVAGIRTPLPLEAMPEHGLGEPLEALVKLAGKLESRYRDVQDVEFTIEAGKLWLLQTRTAKRTAQAAFRIAVEMAGEGAISEDEALSRLSYEEFVVVNRPGIDPEFKVEPVATGTPGCPGLVTGPAVFSSEAAEKAPGSILITQETDPNDVGGMIASAGILTATGGTTCHAAVVARSLNTACIVGCEALKVELFAGGAKLGDHVILTGDKVTLDGTTGRVWLDTEVPVVAAGGSQYVKTALRWAYKMLGVMAEGPDLLSSCQKLMTAEWDGAEAEAADRSYAKLEEMEERSGVLIDLTGPRRFRLAADKILWEIFGDTEPPDEILMKPVVAQLMKRKLKGAIVYVPPELKLYLGALKAAGYEVALEAETLSDLLAAKGGYVTPTDAFINDVAGGRAAFDELVAVFAKAGRKLKAIPATMDATQVAIIAFGQPVEKKLTIKSKEA